MWCEFLYFWLWVPQRSGGTSILGHGREVPWWWHPFWRFIIRLGPYFIPQHDPIDLLFLQKGISVSLSHLVPEILGRKFGLLFHQNVLFNQFKAFCINFLLHVQSNWPPFSLILNLFVPSFSQNLRSNWVQFLLACWTQPATMVKYPHILHVYAFFIKLLLSMDAI